MPERKAHKPDAPKSVKRQGLSLDEKMWIVNQNEKGVPPKTIAREIGRAPSTVYTILSQKEKVKVAFADSTGSVGRKKLRQSNWPDVDEALLEWFHLQRQSQPDLPITDATLQVKAAMIGEKLGKKNGEEKFEPSLGYVSCFKARYNICSKVFCGEEKKYDPADFKVWKEQTIPGLLKDFSPRNIYNADETGLLYQLLPNRTLSFKGNSCKGGQHSKQRLTVLLACNLDGSDKLTPLVIGKYKKPLCFKSVQSLPTGYRANKTAWMTSGIFGEWLTAFDRQMGREHRRVALILDNCSAHEKAVREVHLENITIKWLPANTTRKAQPLDLGVIRSFKARYRRHNLQKSILHVDAGKGVYKPHVLDGMRGIDLAWRDVRSQTISNCFIESGFQLDTSLEETADSNSSPRLSLEEDVSGLLDIIKRECPDLANPEDYIDADSALATEEVSPSTSDDFINSLGEKQRESSESSSDEEDQSSLTAARAPSRRQATAALQVVSGYIQSIPHTQALVRACSDLDAFLVSQEFQAAKMQTRLPDYFRPANVEVDSTGGGTAEARQQVDDQICRDLSCVGTDASDGECERIPLHECLKMTTCYIQTEFIILITETASRS